MDTLLHEQAQVVNASQAVLGNSLHAQADLYFQMWSLGESITIQMLDIMLAASGVDIRHFQKWG